MTGPSASPPASRHNGRSHVRTWTAFGASLALFCWLGWSSYRTLAKLSDSYAWKDHTRTVLETLDVFMAHVTEAESDHRSYIITGETSYIDESNGLAEAARADLSRLSGLTADNAAQQERLRVIIPLARQRLERLSTGIALRRAGGIKAAADFIRGGRGRVLMDALRARTAEMRAEEETLLRERDVRVRSDSRRMALTLSLGGALAVLLLLAAFLALFREGSRRLAAQRRLTEQTSLLQAVLNSAGEGIIVADREGRFTLWNPAATRLVGLGSTEKPPEEWTSVYGVYLPDGKIPYPPEQLPLARAIRGESMDGDEQFLRNAGHPDGAWLSVTGRPLRNAEGELMGGVVVVNDVSDRKRSEEAIRSLNKRIAQRAAELAIVNKEMESFSYSVSHDLRSPLRSIDGFSQAILEDEKGLSAESRENLDRVRAATQRMGRLIDDMLGLSRVTRKEFVREPVDVTAEARDVLEELRRGEPGRRVEAVVAEGLSAAADRPLLRMVLANLIGNAWKFTSRKENARIEVGLRREGAEEAFFVRDDGAGFDMAFAGKLFGVFQRLHPTKDFPGTGIGLATVQRAVQRHGGRVWAESAVDRGAVFFFTLS